MLKYFLLFIITKIPVGKADFTDINRFVFQPSDETKLLNGCSTTRCDLEEIGLGALLDQDTFLDLAVYADRKNGVVDEKCFGNNTNHCSSNYTVTSGEIGGGLDVLPAFLISPPANPSIKNVRSQTKLMYRFSEPLEDSYSILKFTDSKPLIPGSFEIVDTIDSKDIDGGNFVRTEVEISGLTESTIFLAVPSNDIPSIWPDPEDGTTTQKARIFVDDDGYDKDVALYAQLFDISPATPFLPASGWNEGPDKHNHKYSFRKTFTRVQKPSGEDGVVWQDFSNWKIYVTWFTTTGHTTIELPNPGDNYLVVAAGDGGLNGEIIYITFARVANEDKVTPLDVKGIKVNMDGNQITRKTFDASKDGLNILKVAESGSSLIWDTTDNTLGWTAARTMLKGNDGATHQGCKVIILEADTLEILIIKTTSSHSFNNDIQIYNSSATGTEYLAVDLGDNFPRGINVHKINPTKKTSKVVYTFKTKHATKPKEDFGEYTEISTDEITFYRWSNDNRVYTEIAHPPAVIREDGTIMIIFSGESPPLDNSKAIDNQNAPRNLGLVIVSSDLQTVLSEGESSTGGFYTFGGKWTAQANEGIVWLTDFTSGQAKENWESAVRMRTAQIEDDKIFIFYEVWSPTAYIRTDWMVIDTSGNVVTNPVSMTFPLRLSPTDPVIVIDQQAVFFGVDDTGTKLVRYQFGIASEVEEDDEGDNEENEVDEEDNVEEDNEENEVDEEDNVEEDNEENEVDEEDNVEEDNEENEVDEEDNVEEDNDDGQDDTFQVFTDFLASITALITTLCA